MRPQPLGISQRLDHRQNPSQTGPRQPLHTDKLYEIENAEPTPEAGGTTGGQNVIGTGTVITSGLW